VRQALDSDSIGPVDVAVIGFTGDNFSGEIAPILTRLETAGTVRIIDLAFVRKSASGDTDWVEVADAEVDAALSALDDPDQDLLNDEDLMLIAETLEPASAAAVVVWENTWASELVGAIRGAGGELLTQDRIPHEIVVDAVAAISN